MKGKLLSILLCTCLVLLVYLPFSVQSQNIEIPLVFDQLPYSYSDSIWLQLQVATDSLFQDVYCITGFELRGVSAYTFPVLFPPDLFTEYYWRGRHATRRDTTVWCTPYKFTLVVELPVPACTSPEHNAIIQR